MHIHLPAPGKRKDQKAGSRTRILPLTAVMTAAVFFTAFFSGLPAAFSALSADSGFLPALVHAEEIPADPAEVYGTEDAGTENAEGYDTESTEEYSMEGTEGYDEAGSETDANASGYLFPDTYIVTEEGIEDVNAEAEIRAEIAPESNSFASWPEGPYISAESAVAIEAETGTILYAKNMHEKLYPASTTKLLTTLIAYESLPADSMIYVSQSAVDSVPWDGSNIGLSPGEALPLTDMLHGVMIASANEGANALGEAVSGSAAAFSERMNEYAASLGCADSHFVTASGLHEDDHYTTAYDLALIGRRFFSHEELAKIAGTGHYHIPPTALQPDDIYINNTNLFALGEIPCEGFTGGKTGYTDSARSCLVTCAERDGMKIICAVMREETPSQYNDTKAILDYCFANFEARTLADVLADPEAGTITGFAGYENTALHNFSIRPEGTLVLIKGDSLSDVSCQVRENNAGLLDFSANGSKAQAAIGYIPLSENDIPVSGMLNTYKKAGTKVPALVRSVLSGIINTVFGFFVFTFGNISYLHVPHISAFLGILLGCVLFIALLVRILRNFHFGRRIY